MAGFVSVEDARLDRGHTGSIESEVDREWSGRDRDFSAGDGADLIDDVIDLPRVVTPPASSAPKQRS